ncbi:MAG: hypothetical protein LBI13_07425 [Streptococcaceae bacterium]|jgi:uncharacterized membrane protein (TIGR01218 family)|nr:hypothetical protein [Streptococcaceae bacterium]
MNNIEELANVYRMNKKKDSKVEKKFLILESRGKWYLVDMTCPLFHFIWPLSLLKQKKYPMYQISKEMTEGEYILSNDYLRKNNTSMWVNIVGIIGLILGAVIVQTNFNLLTINNLWLRIIAFLLLYFVFLFITRLVQKYRVKQVVNKLRVEQPTEYKIDFYFFLWSSRIRYWLVAFPLFTIFTFAPIIMLYFVKGIDNTMFQILFVIILFTFLLKYLVNSYVNIVSSLNDLKKFNNGQPEFKPIKFERN